MQGSVYVPIAGRVRARRAERRQRHVADPAAGQARPMTTTMIGNLGGGRSAAGCLCLSRQQGQRGQSPDPRFEVKELGAIDMVSRALATLDLVSHDDARPGSPAVHLEGQTVLSYGELAGLVGESERVLRHDSKALVLCAGDRNLPRYWPISPRCA